MTSLLSRMFGKIEKDSAPAAARSSISATDTTLPPGIPAATGSAPRDDGEPERPPSGGGVLPDNLSGLLGSLDKLVFVLDERAIFTAASEPLIQLLGMPGNSLIGRPANDLFIGEGSLISNGTVRFRCANDACYAATLSVKSVRSKPHRSFTVGLLTQLSELPQGSVHCALVHELAAESFNGALQSRLGRLEPPIQLTAGRIELISLHDVRVALGDRWPAQANRARIIADSVIAMRLAADDIFTAVDDECFVICFSSLSLAEARKKSELIAREIRNRLIGEKNDAFTICAQVEEVELDEAEAGDGDLVKVLVTRLDRVRAKRQSDTALKVSQMLANASLHLCPLLSRTLSPTPLMLAQLGGKGIPSISQCSSFGGEDGKLTCDLDTLLLGLVLQHLYQSAADGRGALVIVPVNYTTLHERKFADEYMALCRQIELSARGSILFEICGLTRDVPQLRLEEVSSYLAPFSHHRVIRAFNTDTRFPELHHCRVAMVSIVARRSHQSSYKGTLAFDGFVSTVSGGCKLLVRDIDSEASARWYSARGADFLCYARSD